uniref:Tail fiber protein n=1 Tax=Klebsiella phage FKP3 TaxID=3231233 RepID=A0AAU8I017_9CAUD
MATIKIASLPSATSIEDTDLLILDQADNTKKITVLDLAENYKFISDGALLSETGASKVGTSYNKLLSDLLIPQVNSIADLATLKASSGDRAYTKGAFSENDGGAGEWYFDASNMSSLVSTYPRLFIAPLSDPSGISGAWCLDVGLSIEAIQYGLGIPSLDPSAGSSFPEQAASAALINKNILEQIVAWNAGQRTVKLPPRIIYSSFYLFKGVDPKLEGTPGTSTTTGTFLLTHDGLSTEPLIKITSTTDSASSRVSGLNLKNIACASQKFFSTTGYNTFTDNRDARVCYSINFVGTHVRIEGLYAGGFNTALYANEVWDGFINNCRFLYCSTPTGSAPAVFIGTNATDNTNNMQINHMHIEFSPYALEVGFCEHVSFQSCKIETYRQAAASHNVIKIQPEATKVNFNSCMVVSNNASNVHVVQDAGQFTKWNHSWFSGADDAGYPQAGVHWYRRVSPTNSQAELNGCYFNRCHVTDGSEPLDYSIILNNYTKFSGQVRVSPTYNTSSGSVVTSSTGLLNIGTSCNIESLHIIVGSGTKSAGAVLFFAGTGSTVGKITQTAGDVIYKLVSGDANNTVQQYGQIYQNTSNPVIDSYGRRVIFLTSATSVTQINGLVGEEITIISNVSGSTLVYNSSLLITTTGANISMSAGKPYKFIMTGATKAVQI